MLLLFSVCFVCLVSVTCCFGRFAFKKNGSMIIVDLKIFGRCDEFMWLSFHQASERLTLARAELPTAQGQLALCTACSQRSQTRAKVS